MAIAPIHLNNNLLCAVDIETTGLNYKLFDIIQIAVIPLGPDYKVSNFFRPFITYLQPQRDPDPEAMSVSFDHYENAKRQGLDPDSAVDRFEDWFAALGLPERKKLVGIGHNLRFDFDFIREWLGGPISFDHFFRSDYRDSMQTALFLNDWCEMRSEPVPFPKVKLGYICNCLGVEYKKAHDAAADAVASVECYVKMLKKFGFKIT